MGGALSIEWQTVGDSYWHRYFNYPKIGVSGVFMSLSNPEMLGNLFAVYPYLQVPVVKTDFFSLNVKTGGGLAYITKNYKNSPHLEGTLNGIDGTKNGANGAIGSPLNVFLALAANVEIPVSRSFSLTADAAYNHASNGSTVQPNSGINMLNAYVGVKYQPKPQKNNTVYSFENNISKKIQVELTLSGGWRELYYKDAKTYPIASMALAAYKPLTNWYRMGLGVDAFYDGVFGYVNVPQKSGQFQKTFIEKDEFKNKIRAGISWQHEAMIGKLNAGFHFGVYLFNSIKNLEPYGDVRKNNGKPLDKGVFYGYDIDKEDGWFYTRAIVKYNITTHFYAAVGIKTHLQKAEFIEWGLGCRF
jgi:hypothetical protein